MARQEPWLMNSFAKLMSGEYGVPPSECPVRNGIPNNRDGYPVPEAYRPLLALIVAARKEVSIVQSQYGPANPSAVPKGMYFQYASRIDEKAAELNHALFRLVANPRATAIEFHANWLFSVLTPEDVEREYIAALGKDGKKTTSEPKGIVPLDYSNQLTEVEHLTEFYLRRYLDRLREAAYGRDVYQTAKKGRRA